MRYLIDQHRDAQMAANKYGLPQTVFYHPEWGFSNTCPGSKILHETKTEKFVTWLPDNYFKS